MDSYLSQGYIYKYIYIFTNVSAWAGCDTRSLFMRNLTGLNIGFPSLGPVAIPRLKRPVCSTNLPKDGGRIVGLISSPSVFTLCEMQTASSRIWTRAPRPFLTTITITPWAPLYIYGGFGIGLHVKAHKTEYMCFNQTGDISILDGTFLKLVDKFTYLGSSVLSTEKDMDTRLTKAWTAIDRLSIIWKSDLTDKMKRSFFQAAVVSILLCGCTTWTLTKQLEKKLDGNYTRVLRAILNKSWRQHPTRHQLYGHLPPITKTIQVRRTRHAGHCWRSKDELISDVLLWTPACGQAKAGRPARTYIQKLCEDTGCSPEDLPEAMNDRKRGSGISVLAARHDDDDDGGVA